MWVYVDNLLEAMPDLPIDENWMGCVTWLEKNHECLKSEIFFIDS